MPIWERVVVGVFVLIVIGVALLALLAVRRRWLAKGGGAFECSVRWRASTPSAGWVLGMARYSGDALDWFRFFSYATRPQRSFRRIDVRITETRHPDPVEAVALYEDQLVVTLEDRGEPDRRWDLAMSPESLTGLMSWLEAAPPGPPRQ